MKRQRGFSLVEMLAVIAVSGVLLVIATGAIHRAMRVESNWRQEAEVSRALGRLTHDVRADIHEARGISLSENPSAMELTAPDGTVTTYEVASDEVIRDYQPVSGARAREFYRKPAGYAVRFASDAAQRWVVMTVTHDAELVGVAPQVVVHLEAEVGRLARLTQSMGDTP